MTDLVFLKFKLINKGGKTFNDFMISLWLDPDLGSAMDDMVGSDSLHETMFCYNATNVDPLYSQAPNPVPPAIGARLLEGPIVPSPGSVATVDGVPIADHRNLGLYSICYYINGTDPDSYQETYQYMHGLQAKVTGAPPYQYMGNDTRFWVSGDPVMGVGDLDHDANDKRIMATLEPFDFLPNDTQQVIFSLAVGQGADYLSSIIVMRRYLDGGSIPTDVENESDGSLPDGFLLTQNYPNPFNPTTTIAYSLPERAEVEIAIFNVVGQRVTTLKEGVQSAGEHTVVWTGVDDSGEAVATGVYFYRVRAGDNVSTRKMLLLK